MDSKFIYGLVDPRDGKVRYVGASKDPMLRYKQQLARYAWPTDLREWLDELKNEGLRPDLRLFTDEPVEHWRTLEKRIQAQYASTLLDLAGRGTAVAEEYTREQIGAALRSAREEAGITQSEAAASLHVAPATLSRWESGGRAVSISQALRVANSYGVPLGEIFPIGQPSQGAAADLKRAHRTRKEKA